MELWLWRWLVEFWVGDVCGCSGRQCCGCSGFRCVGFRSLIDRLGWILGQWWCRGCGGGWLSFGSAMFVAVVGGGVCGCSGPAVFVEDFEFLFLFLFFFVEVF